MTTKQKRKKKTRALWFPHNCPIISSMVMRQSLYCRSGHGICFVFEASKDYYPKLEYSHAYFFKDTDTNLDRYAGQVFEIAGQ